MRSRPRVPLAFVFLVHELPILNGRLAVIDCSGAHRHSCPAAEASKNGYPPPHMGTHMGTHPGTHWVTGVLAWVLNWALTEGPLHVSSRCTFQWCRLYDIVRGMSQATCCMLHFTRCMLCVAVTHVPLQCCMTHRACCVSRALRRLVFAAGCSGYRAA